MKFYIYDKSSISYKRFYFLKFKNFIIYFIIQIFITIGCFFIFTSLYDTPKEKKLKESTTYLLNQFNEINQKIIESEVILQQIKDRDSIVYNSIFDITDITKHNFISYYEIGSINDYSNIVEITYEKLLKLDQQLAKEAYLLSSLITTAYSHQDMLIHLPAIQPIDNKDLKRIASGWGYRIHPIYNIMKFHYGLDFTAPIGTPIYATGDGTIQYIIKFSDKASQGYGNLIIINHGYGYRTLYSHINKFKVKIGQKVKRGEVIGYVGNSGLSTGPHLHYEVIKNGSKVNPINYLFHNLSPKEYQRIVEISNSIKKSYD